MAFLIAARNKGAETSFWVPPLILCPLSNTSNEDGMLKRTKGDKGTDLHLVASAAILAQGTTLLRPTKLPCTNLVPPKDGGMAHIYGPIPYVPGS